MRWHVHEPLPLLMSPAMSPIALSPVRVIGLDSRNLALPHGTGAATYAAMLARCLPQIDLLPEVLVDFPRRSRIHRWADAALPGARRVRPADPSPEGWQVQAGPDLFRAAQIHFDVWGRLRSVTSATAPDLMHWTYPLPMRFIGCPNLYAVHDIIPLLRPELTSIDPRRARRMLDCIVQTADHLITVSETVRKQLIATVGVRPERVTNTWQAVDVAGAAERAPAGVTPGCYWLHVGVVERRKNLNRLIEAWKASGTPHSLVLAGPDGWHAATVTIDHPAIIRLPWLARPELLALIRDARGLLMPSLAEGFGLPVAEAMASGTPVLTSDGGALAEVADSAAVLVDPQDGQSIAEGMRALDRDPALRERLRYKGLMRAKLFTPDAYAGRLRSLYGACRR